jgi:hypothetical protein
VTLWGNVLYLIGQRPLAGWGWGELDYAHFMTLYPGARFCDILDNAHNLPLHLAVELGLPVAIGASVLGIWLVWRPAPWRERDPMRQMAWAVLALILLHSMLEYPLWYGPFQIAAILCIWVLWANRDSLPSAQAKALPVGTHAASIDRPFSPAQAIAACAAVSMLAGVAYAAWDYHRVSQIYLAPDQRAEGYRLDTFEKIRASRLFRNQVRFAELTTTELAPDNALHVNALAKEMLHFSPEVRVVEKLVDSALMLGREQEAAFYLARYRAAFPTEYAAWQQRLAHPQAQLPAE